MEACDDLRELEIEEKKFLADLGIQNRTQILTQEHVLIPSLQKALEEMAQGKGYDTLIMEKRCGGSILQSNQGDFGKNYFDHLKLERLLTVSELNISYPKGNISLAPFPKITVSYKDTADPKSKDDYKVTLFFQDIYITIIFSPKEDLSHIVHDPVKSITQQYQEKGPRFRWPEFTGYVLQK